MLTTIERRKEIVEETNRIGKVDVAELAGRYGVSTVTIRNDLGTLDKKGLLIRSRGGALANSKVARELSITEKHSENSEIKQKLGEAAAAYVNEGESIILDSGTTTEELASNLLKMNNLFVMTNGMNIALKLNASENIEVLMTGGTLRKKSMSFYGRQAEEHLENLRFDKFFLGVDGIDEISGITTHFEQEASLNRVMCKSSRKVIAVTDSSKFDRSGFHIIASFEQVDTLITDSNIPEHFKEMLVNAGVELVIVEV